MKHYKYFYIFYKFYIVDNKHIESKLFVDKLLHFSTLKMMFLTSKGVKKQSVSTVVVSFYKMKYVGSRTFVGLQNYKDMFTRKDIFQSLKLSLYYMGGSVLQLVLALFLATLLSFKTK